jgi:NADP-dependent 3-hydroxy acid dehydrogenase YdfG
MASLTDKIAFITGASAGIGKACAHAFAREGANLILTARRGERIEALAQTLSAQHKIRCHWEKLDIRDQPAVESFVRDLPPEFRAVEILLNNAGLSRGLSPLHQGELQDWEEMIDTNLKGLLYVTRALLPGMVERGRGHIVNIGSIAGRQVYPGGNVYCATKFAVRALTQGMLMELANTPIRVSAVDPGLTETEFSLVRFHGDAERAAGVYKGIEALRSEDIADAVLYVVTRPPHVNVAEMVMLPTAQGSVHHINRKG